jgi:hypothetical protein
MKSTLFITALAGAQLALAHTFVYGIHINGVDQGRGDGKKGNGDKIGKHIIRSVSSNNPVMDVSSKAMTCNTPGAVAPYYATVKGGDKVCFPRSD